MAYLTARFEPQYLDGKTPNGYKMGADGTERKPGLYGNAGFGGTIIDLLPGDDGQWFLDLKTEFGDADQVDDLETEEHVEWVVVGDR